MSQNSKYDHVQFAIIVSQLYFTRHSDYSCKRIQEPPRSRARSRMKRQSHIN